MFKMIILFVGLLNGDGAQVTLTSNTLYSTYKDCIEEVKSDKVSKDIDTYLSTLKDLGYEIEIVKTDCEDLSTRL